MMQTLRMTLAAGVASRLWDGDIVNALEA